jgi:lysozyme family protein
MSSLKSKIINKILEIEGGYINDPNDSGGETKFGITKKLAMEFGYYDVIINLPKSAAFEIYEEEFWNKLNLTVIEEISPKIAEELADTGVNLGVARAGKFLQRALNVLNNRENYYKDLVIDGVIGTATIDALQKYLSIRGVEGGLVLFKMLNSLQGTFYIELAERREKDEKFIYGWFKNRIS